MGSNTQDGCPCMQIHNQYVIINVAYEYEGYLIRRYLSTILVVNYVEHLSPQVQHS